MKAIVLALAVLLAGCESTPERTYWDLINDPLPAEGEREHHCAWLRSEMARMQSAAQYAVANTSPQWALLWQAKARDNIAALQSRYSQIPCDSTRVTIEDKSKMTFDQCYAKCTELTSRTDEQCFDTCK